MNNVTQDWWKDSLEYKSFFLLILLCVLDFRKLSEIKRVFMRNETNGCDVDGIWIDMVGLLL